MGYSDKSHTNTTGEQLSCIIPEKQESGNKFEGFIFSGMLAFLQYLLNLFVSVYKHVKIQEQLNRL
jgi:hypothetical protein